MTKQARAARTSKSDLVARYVIEKSLETECPGISFRDSLSGREAYLTGHRVAVWEVDDAALLIACAQVSLVLVAFDRATLPWHAGQVLRAGENHGGLILFRRSVRSTDYGQQARLLTRFWADGAHGWNSTDRIVYLPKSP